jgi:hypothetical protein
MLKDSTNTATKNTENKSITYKDGKESAVVTEKETAESNNDPNTVRLEDKKKEGPFLTSERNLSEDGKIKSKDKDRSPKKSNPRNEVNIKNGNTESAKALPVGIDELKTERDRAGGKIDTAKNDTGFAISSGIAAPSLGNNLAKLDTSEEARQNKESTKNDSTALLKNKAKVDSTVQSFLPKEKSKIRVGLDFSGGPQFNSIKYGSGSGNYQAYIDQSRQSEKETPSFTAAFGLVLTLNKFIIETGLKHSLLTSEFSYSESYNTIDTSHSHADSSGNWIHVSDTIPGTTHYMATNKISFLEFPLIVGYSFLANKFEIEVKSGLSLSLITNANTTIYSLNTGEVIRYDELSNSPYRKSLWNLLVATNMLYDLSGRVSVFFQPSMKLGLNSVFKDNYPVTKKVQSAFLGIGLRLKL